MMKKLILVAIGLIVFGLIGMFATGFNFGDNHPYHEKRWSFNEGELKQLIIEGSSTDIDVKFITSTDGSSYVEFRGRLEQRNFNLLSEAIISNGILHLDLQQKHVISILDLNLGRYDRDVIIALPDHYQLESVIVKMNSADVKILNGRANTVDVSTSSGRLTIDKLVANELTMETNSGNIEANDLNAKVIATAGSGNIEIDGLIGEGTFETSSGNIQIVQREANMLDVIARSGNITITPASDFGGFYDLKSNSGNIKSPESKRETTDLIKVRTNSGNIKIKE